MTKLLSSALRKIQRHYKKTALLSLAVLVTGCSSVDNSGSLFGFLTPYRPDILQGNWVTQSQVESLQKGMTREQVRYALGTPLVRDVFNADRWDYVYRFQNRRGLQKTFYLSVFFENNQLVTWKHDNLPELQPFQEPNPETAPTESAAVQ